MIDLFVKHKYLYFGDDLEIIFFDTTRTSTAITFTITSSDGSVTYDTWTVATDTYGYLSTTRDIESATYGTTGTYKLTATGGSSTQSLYFLIDYTGVLIARGMDTLLQAFQEVPVYDENSIIKVDGSTYYATLPIALGHGAQMIYCLEKTQKI